MVEPVEEPQPGNALRWITHVDEPFWRFRRWLATRGWLGQ